jgi:hypothetical protein
MSTAFTGLLEGFVKTKLTLDEREEKRQKEQADLDLRKQDLALKRKILEGEQASRQLQDQMHALNIQDLVIKLGKQIRDQDARNALKDPAVTPDATGATTPSLAPGGPPTPLGATAPETPALPTEGQAVPSTAPLFPSGGAITPTPLSPSPPTGPTMATWRTVQPTPEILTAARREAQAAAVPTEHLLGLGAVESGMDPAARGPMTRFGWQAQGYGQLSPDTGKRFGVTDPYNLDQNMAGTAKAWKEALQKAKGDPRVAYQKYYNPGASDALTDKVLFSMARFRELGTDPTATPAGRVYAAGRRPGRSAGVSGPLARGAWHRGRGRVGARDGGVGDRVPCDGRATPALLCLSRCGGRRGRRGRRCGG